MKRTQELRISKNLSLPLDTVTSTLVVYGGKGMGKTNLASVLVEEFAACGLRFVVVDPMGVWWGLRHSADGKGSGIEVLILGGIHGDLPIEPMSGALVADLVVDEDASVIIDISRRADGSMWAIAERVRFMTDYAKRLYQRQGEKRGPIMQVIDEAARFVPQVIRSGDLDVAKCMGAVTVLVEEGRNVGIGVTLITQRSARLNKDVAELADCMIAFRIMGPNSMRAVLDWLGEHVDKGRLKEIGKQLRELPRGSALVVSPGWLEFEGIVGMRKRETFDSSATPKPGQQVRASGPGKKPDLDKYRKRLAEVVERAKADDPKALRARVAELEKQLAKGRLTSVAKVETKTIEKHVVKASDIARIEKLADRLTKDTDRLDAQRDRLAQAQQAIVTEIGLLHAKIAATLSPQTGRSGIERKFVAPQVRSDTPRGPSQNRAATSVRAAASDSDTSTVSGAEMRILGACAWMEAIGQGEAANEPIAFLAGYTVNGHFTNLRGKLHTAGLIEYPSGGKIRMTDAGRAMAPAVERAPTTEALHQAVLARIDNAKQRLLKPLIEAWPDGLTNEDLAEQSGYTINGHFTNLRGRLRSLGLATYPGPNMVRAANLLFPGAS